VRWCSSELFIGEIVIVYEVLIGRTWDEEGQLLANVPGWHEARYIQPFINVIISRHISVISHQFYIKTSWILTILPMINLIKNLTWPSFITAAHFHTLAILCSWYGSVPNLCIVIVIWGDMRTRKSHWKIMSTIKIPG